MTLIEACAVMQHWLCDITAGGKTIPQALGSRGTASGLTIPVTMTTSTTQPQETT